MIDKNQTVIENDLKNPDHRWIVCPYCGKRVLRIMKTTKIGNMPVKCKGSNCKREFIVNC